MIIITSGLLLYNEHILSLWPEWLFPDSATGMLKLPVTTFKPSILEAMAKLVLQKRDDLGRVKLSKGKYINGYNSYTKTLGVTLDQVPHKASEQQRNSLLFNPLERCRRWIPALDEICEALEEALKQQFGTRICKRFEQLHAHALNQRSRFTQFARHTDSEENCVRP